MRGWGMRAACAALVMALVGVAAPAWADEFELDEYGLEIRFDHAMRVVDNTPPKVTSDPARAWECSWGDDTTLQCFPEQDLPRATPVRVFVPALQRADGSVQRARVLRADTTRPELHASVAGPWDEGGPRVTVTTLHRLDVAALQRHLVWTGGGRTWPVPAITPVEREQDAREYAFRVALPPELPPDTILSLVVPAGLRSEDGPLTSKDVDTVARVHVGEPLRVRALRCRLGLQPSRARANDGAIACNADAPLNVLVSGELDAPSLEALRAMLPAGLTVSVDPSPYDWDAHQGGRSISRALGSELVIRSTLPPGTTVPLRLPDTLRANDGRRFTPTVIDIQYRQPQPAIVATATDGLVGDARRAGGLEVVNGHAVTLRATALSDASAEDAVRLPATREARAEVPSAVAQAALERGGTVLWSNGDGYSRLIQAAPQFDVMVVHARERTVVAWAVEWETSEPIPGASIELGLLSFDGTWTTVAEGTTDRDGLATLTIADDRMPPEQVRGQATANWMVHATSRGRRAVLPARKRGELWAPYSAVGGSRTRGTRLFTVTDRPLYRAGDTLRLQGWIRANHDGVLMNPQVEAFVLRLQQQDLSAPSWAQRDGGDAVVEWTVTPDARGAFTSELPLPVHMLDGTYCVREAGRELKGGGCVFVGTYRAQDLWTEATLSRTSVRMGESVTMAVEAGYLSGGAAASVPVTLVQVSTRHASPAEAFPAFAAFAFGSSDSEEGATTWSGIRSVPGTEGLRLDGQGRASVAWAALPPFLPAGEAAPSFARAVFLVGVDLEGGEPVQAKPVTAWVHAGRPLLGLRLTPHWVTPSAPVVVTAVLLDGEGRALPAAPVSLTVSYVARDADEAVDLATCTLTVGQETPCAFPRARSGVYRFTARSQGAEDAVVERYIHVPHAEGGEDEVPAELTLTTPPASHDAPMTLELRHGYTRADALVLVTAGDSVLNVQRIRVDGPRHVLTLPTHAGGRNAVQVSLLLRERSPLAVRPDGTRATARYRVFDVDVAVPLAPAPRSLTLRFEDNSARPGGTVRLRVRNDSPTARSVTLAVFDDALRQLAGDRWEAVDPRGEGWLAGRAAPETTFRANTFEEASDARRIDLPWPKEDVRPAGVAAPPAGGRRKDGDLNDPGAGTEELDMISVTGSRIPEQSEMEVGGFMSIDRADLDGAMLVGLVNERVPAPTRIADGRPPNDLASPTTGRGPTTDRSAFGARVRNAFLQTVLWEPSVTLQPGEERVFTLTLPDNLTRWHAAAWSVSGDDDFTLDTAQIEVGLPVEVRLLTPARLYPGDRARLIGNVRHTGDAAATAETALWTEGVEADAVAQVPLVAGGQAPFALHVAPTDADQARTSALRAVAAARVNGVADAVSRGITLASPRIRATRVQAGWLGRRPVRLDLPTLPRTAQDAMLQVTLLPGADALVHDWIDDLHRYPHRCWEQILSRAVAAAVALERGDGDRFPDAKAAIDEALRNIPVFQDERGGFRYFADEAGNSRGDPVLTAYSVRALRLLSMLGYDVPLKAISKADGYLNLAHSGLDDSDADRIRLAYVAAGQERPRRDLTDRLWGAFDTLPLHAQVAAASAMADGRHPEAGAAVQRLMKRAPLRGEARVLQAGERSDRWMGSDLREQCALLDVLYRHPALVSESDRRALVMGLGNLYAGGIGDVDTQTGAVCLMALRALPPAGSSGVTLEVAHGDARTTLALADGAPRTFTTPASASGAVQLRGTVPGEAPASYRVEVQYTEDARQATSTAIGFALERRHAVLRDGQWVPVQGQQVREGDWVRVTLVVRTAAERHFVALTDDAPGGLQPTDLTLSGVAGLDLQAVSSTGSAWFGTRRLDPMAPKFYARYLPEGTHEVHYFARVGNAGDYLAAPAQAELMYGAATRARTGAQRLEFLPAE